MNYTEFLEEIFAKTATDRKIELTRIRKFLDAIDNPEKKLQCIHVAGTNGKGSTCAAIESILHAHDFSVGLNTSPHLVDYKERFRINKQEVEPEELLNLYFTRKAAHDTFDTTYFEISTAIAFELFFNKGVDFSIMEVGLGGRLDASVLLNAVITVITNIEYDHTKSLGKTLPKIAGEKAGILKKGIPLVLGTTRPSARKVILRKANELSCPVVEYDKVVTLSNERYDEDGVYYEISITAYDVNFKGIHCNLAGKHQVGNTALGVLVCAVLAKYYGFVLDEEKTKHALASVVWNGRLQKVGNNPTIILDGAHNPAGMKQLVHNLKTIYSYDRLIAVIGILYDKNIHKMIQTLAEVADVFVISKSQSHRAAPVEILEKEVKRTGKDYHARPDSISAFEHAKAIAHKNDLICVCGSLYTIGEVLGYCENNK
ncbi:MAG: bifunctional folylpolyglutamate synthase/dihydrofolate synthase [Candidatus Cloacimonetes bacterium]|nr:bifunctional folylpolyglutamate synthase/dihydrofolate synthase [Candidatus Cloacimonadota bacterium]